MQQGETLNETARRQKPYTTLRITNQGVDAGQRSEEKLVEVWKQAKKTKSRHYSSLVHLRHGFGWRSPDDAVEAKRAAFYDCP